MFRAYLCCITISLTTHEQQAKCKDCYHDSRSLASVAVRQSMKEDLEEMEKNDPKQHDALVKAFLKEREATKKSGKRMKSCIHTFIFLCRKRLVATVAARGMSQQASSMCSLRAVGCAVCGYPQA